MFTDRDMDDYCRQIETVELGMEEFYRNLAALTSAPEHKVQFEKLASEEKGHACTVAQLRKFVS